MPAFLPHSPPLAHPADAGAYGPHSAPETLPPCSRTLGERVVEIDREARTCVIEFHAGEHLLNPVGAVQGGFVAAMLDDAFTIALLGATDVHTYAPTLEMKVSYFRPAPPGRLIAKGRVVHMGKSTGFTESELFDAAGNLLAKASATLAIRRGKGPAGDSR